MKNKVCTVCKNEFKPKSGIQKYCSQQCKSIGKKDKHLIYELQNKNKLSKYRKNYYIKHKKEILRYRKQYHETHKKENKQYRENHKEKIAEYMKTYRKIHRNRAKIIKRKWDKKHRKEVTIYRRLYQTKRLKTDITFKILWNLSVRIRKVLKGINKSKSTMKLLGCSIEFFKQYYKSKFTKGMNWKKVMNGEIHCDHIKPCCQFDLSKSEEQRKCFHYTNLQPLWAKDNLKKGIK